MVNLILPILRLLLSKAQGCKDFKKPSKPCHVGIHKLALTGYSHMSTHMPGFHSFSSFFALSYIGKISHHQHKGNPLLLAAAKSCLTTLMKSITVSDKDSVEKMFYGVILITTLSTTLFEIFCKTILYFQVIFKSIIASDVYFKGNSEEAI